MKDLKVIVQMITYNHAPYVRQAVESVMMQETDFPFQLIICDDCSRDKTPEICLELKEKYPQRIILKLNEENMGALRNAKQIHKLCLDIGSTYVAACEGDDYWTDPLKLQKQVDFLESAPDFNICWTWYAIHDENGITELDWTGDDFKSSRTEITLTNIFDFNRTNTLTMLWRHSALNFHNINKFEWPKDITLYCLALSTGKGAILNFKAANYRIHSGGSYSAVGAYTQNLHNYRSLREIVQLIPECNIEYMHIRMMWSLEQAIFIACGQEMHAVAYREVLESHRELFRIAPSRRRLSGLRELMHQSARRIRHKLKSN